MSRMRRTARPRALAKVNRMTPDESATERVEAVRALESVFGELVGRFRQIVAESAQRVSPGMLPGAYKVFTTIVRNESVTQSALAEQLLVDKGQLSRTVRELEQRGLVERTPDPSDRRASLLSATAEGGECLARARGSRENALAGSLAEWPLDDIRALARLLHALAAGDRP